MIPITLTIKGLYSYQEETNIQFANLTASGLFGIFGAVGSGKSSILEAISFALYGETERLNFRESRSYNMMNLKSNDLLIDFIFTCGDCNDKYKFTVSARRKKNKFDDVSSFDRKAYIFKDSDWKPIDVTAESILGLSYDNFKRTIIIPQGKFQEFLQLKEAERVQMLKEIFNLGKYELGNKVSKLIKENDLKISNLQGQMVALPEHNPELLREKQLQLDELVSDVSKLADELAGKRDKQEQAQNIKVLFEEQKSKKDAFETLKEREKAINELRNQIIIFERCQQQFKAPFESRNYLSNSLNSLLEDVRKLKKDEKGIEDLIKNESAKIEKLQAQYDSRGVLLKRADELVKIIEIQNVNIEILNLSQRIEAGSKVIKDTEKGCEDLNANLTNIKKEISEKEKALPDTAVLIGICTWFNKNRELNENILKAKNKKNEISKDILEIQDKINSILETLNQLIEIQEFPENMNVVEKEVERVIQGYETELKQLNKESLHLQLSRKLDEFAKNLCDNDQCPLCGSTDHPSIYSAENISEELTEKQNHIKNFNDKKVQLQGALVKLSSSYSRYEWSVGQLKQYQQEQGRFHEQVEKFRLTFSFNGYKITDEEVVKKELSQMEETNEVLKNLRNEWDNKEKQLKEDNKKLQKYKEGREGLLNEKAKLNGQVESLQTQISFSEFHTEVQKPSQDLLFNNENLRTEHANVTGAYEQAASLLQNNRTTLAGLTGQLGELKNQEIKFVQQKNAVDQQITDLLLAAGFDTEKEVENVLETSMDIERERQEIEHFQKELHTLDTQLKILVKKVGDKTYDPEEHKLLVEAISTLEREVSEKTQQLGNDKRVVKELTEQMNSRLKMQELLDNLLLRAANLKVLSNLFKASGFVNYVSSVYLQNLVNSANERFSKMTGQKLLLELDNDNAFRVRDFMNNGEVRSVKTLSGGQTFQAALSLALALADNIQHLTKSSQNFFFLDEGFGSLDREALAIVFDTLKNLRKENRIVGVISHVDEMQQEIPVNLKVVNDPERGSLIAYSWN